MKQERKEFSETASEQADFNAKKRRNYIFQFFHRKSTISPALTAEKIIRFNCDANISGMLQGQISNFNAILLKVFQKVLHAIDGNKWKHV